MVEIIMITLKQSVYLRELFNDSNELKMNITLRMKDAEITFKVI